ncbi:MAG: vWA domain-containing protein, partial [Candidatus Thiodiazotropha sp.]
MRTNKPKSNNWHSLSALALISLFVFISSTAHSDDIDVYYHEPFDPVPPNILFVLDESGSMEWGNEICSYPGSPNRRRDLLVDALKEVFNNDEMSNVNAALMGYAGVDEDEQGFRAYSGAFKVISEGNNKSDFLEQIDKLGADGSTPTVRALHYAVEWFKPGDPFFRYNYTNYDSPLVAEDVVAEKMRCAPNHIVLLSDGAPNGNSFTDYNGVKCDTSNLLFMAGTNNNID